MVPGSHSKVISSAESQERLAVTRLTSDSSWRVERNEGVPPPKYTKLNGLPAIAGWLA